MISLRKIRKQHIEPAHRCKAAPYQQGSGEERNGFVVYCFNKGVLHYIQTLGAKLTVMNAYKSSGYSYFLDERN